MKITWPLTAAETSLAPGSSLAVKVRSSHRRAQLALLRVDARGRAIRAVARKTLRSGTFSVALPATAGRAVPARARGRRQALLELGHDACPGGGGTGTGTGTRSGTGRVDPATTMRQLLHLRSRLYPLGRGSDGAAVAVTPAVIPAGERVTLSIQNVGTTCLISSGGSVGECFTHERPDGTARKFPHDCMYLQTGAFTLIALPGETWSGSYAVPADAEPGTYRASTYFGYVDFEVVPAA